MIVVRPLTIPDVKLVKLCAVADARGTFVETYNRRDFTAAGIEVTFVQDNESLSHEVGTVRGLHFQRPPHAQAKLVRVRRGAALDIAVDIRPDSPTFGRHVAVELIADGTSLYIPAGFAHGFCTLLPGTEIAYKVSAHYAPDFEGGLLWSDPDLGIKWPVAPDRAILNARDRAWPTLRALTAAGVHI